MNASDKAKELIGKYWNQIYYNTVNIIWERKINDKPNLMLMQCIACGIICVDEIISYQNVLIEEIGADKDGYLPTYWKEVKSEIEKLK